MVAVIAGATGLVGSVLVRKLLADPEIDHVISVSRKTLGIPNPKLREFMVRDLSELSKIQSDLKGDVYFCALGTTIKDAGTEAKFRAVDYDAIVEFGRIARSHNAKCFVVISSSGANEKSRVFYSRVKGETESALQSLGLNRLVVVRPSLLIGHRKKPRSGEQFFVDAVTWIGPILPTPLKKRMMTPITPLAERMVSEAKSQEPGVSVIEARDI